MKEHSVLFSQNKTTKASKNNFMLLFWITFLTAIFRHFLLACWPGSFHELLQLPSTQHNSNCTQIQVLNALGGRKQRDQPQVIHTKGRQPLLAPRRAEEDLQVPISPFLLWCSWCWCRSSYSIHTPLEAEKTSPLGPLATSPTSAQTKLGFKSLFWIFKILLLSK